MCIEKRWRSVDTYVKHNNHGPRGGGGYRSEKSIFINGENCAGRLTFFSQFPLYIVYILIPDHILYYILLYTYHTKTRLSPGTPAGACNVVCTMIITRCHNVWFVFTTRCSRLCSSLYIQVIYYEQDSMNIYITKLQEVMATTEVVEVAAGTAVFWWIGRGGERVVSCGRWSRKKITERKRKIVSTPRRRPTIMRHVMWYAPLETGHGAM